MLRTKSRSSSLTQEKEAKPSTLQEKEAKPSTLFIVNIYYSQHLWSTDPTSNPETRNLQEKNPECYEQVPDLRWKQEQLVGHKHKQMKSNEIELFTG
jgi:hypothetical protein